MASFCIQEEFNNIQLKNRCIPPICNVDPRFEVFHVYLVIFGNTLFPWVSLISRNTQSSRKQFFIFIFWFETVSEVE